MMDGVRRSDDGLYECQAENEGGRFSKSGHIQVGLCLMEVELMMTKHPGRVPSNI